MEYYLKKLKVSTLAENLQLDENRFFMKSLVLNFSKFFKQLKAWIACQEILNFVCDSWN